MDLLCISEIDKWTRRENKYEKNLNKVYALVLSYCSKVTKNRIDSSLTYQSNIQDNTILLLNTIKVIMHDPDRTKYAYVSLT